MQTKVLLIKAEEIPIKGVESKTPNQIYKNSKLVIEERTLDVLKPDEIRIKMLYVGICGSDVHLSKNNPETGYISCSAPAKIPMEGRIIGHEGVGLVLSVGSNVKNLKKGMYVTLESIVVCNTCDACKKGNFNQCRNAKLVGLEVDGLMGTVVDVNANLAHNITDYVKSERDLISMACVEPAAVAYVACENAQIKGGDVVAIFGGGPIGAFTAILSKLVFGAAEIHIVEPIEFRRNLLKEWTEYVYESVESLQKNLKKISIIIEASGDLSNVNKVFNIIDANGKIVLLARSGESLSITNVDHMITNNIIIKGSRGHLCGAFDRILKLHISKRINLDSVVTSIVDGIDNVKELLESSDILIKDNCKVVVRFANIKN